MLLLVMFLISGCTAWRYLTGKKDIVKIPQILADIKPVLADNAILITGKILIQNPNETNLELSEVQLSFLDEQDKIFKREVKLGLHAGSISILTGVPRLT